jgi:hypothetical protein
MHICFRRKTNASVRQRTSETGVRMALEPSEVTFFASLFFKAYG